MEIKIGELSRRTECQTVAAVFNVSAAAWEITQRRVKIKVDKSPQFTSRYNTRSRQ